MKAMTLRSPVSSIYPTPESKDFDKRQVAAIKGENLCAMIPNKGSVLEIEHNYNDEELYNIKTVAVYEKHQTPFDFDAYLNLHVKLSLKSEDTPMNGGKTKSTRVNLLSLDSKRGLQIRVMVLAHS